MQKNENLAPQYPANFSGYFEAGPPIPRQFFEKEAGALENGVRFLPGLQNDISI